FSRDWSSDVCSSDLDFCRRLVTRYLLNDLSWEDADMAANNICLLMIKDCGGRVPDYAWDVYLAFDEGEIGDRGDSFTRERILERSEERRVGDGSGWW